MKVFDTSNLDLSKYSEETRLHIYNGMDTCLTHEIFTFMDQNLLDDVSRPTSQFMTSLLGPVMSMMRRGIRVDLEAQDKALVDLRARLFLVGGMERRVKSGKGSWHVTNEDAPIQALAKTVWGKTLNYHSAKQLKEFFFDHLYIPKIYRSDKGVQKVALDRNALEKIQKYYFRGVPFAELIMWLRDREKEIDVFSKALSPDGRFLYNINIGGTTSGRFSSSEHPFDLGCVPGNAEVLTPAGWIRIDEVISGQKIMQWDDKTHELSFAPAEPVSYPFNKTSEMVQVKSSQYDLCITKEHRIPYWATNSDDNLCKVTDAFDLATSRKSAIRTPVSGYYTGGSVDFRLIRLAVACLADGSYEGGSFRLAFKKQRKIDRFLALCEEFCVPVSEQSAPKGYRRFSIPGKEIYNFTQDKFGPWVMSLTSLCARNLLDELQHWDSHIRNRSYLFASVDEEQVRWLITLAHMYGMSATYYTYNNRRGYGIKNAKPLHIANFKPRSYVFIQPEHSKFINGVDNVYCVTVPTSFFMIRYNGKICVTGNSNIQNIDPALRYIFVPDPGYVFLNVDLKTAESVVVAYLSGDEAYIDALRGDVHTTVAGMVWNFEPIRTLADRKYYRNFTYRDMSKRGGHGSNYHGSPRTMARHLKVETSVMESFQRRYFDVFPEIPKWHLWTQRHLQTHGQLTTPLGRRRFFWDRLNSDTTLRESIAYVPQSTVGDLVHEGELRCWRELQSADCHILSNGHDAILFQVRESKAHHYAKEVLRRMEIPIEVLDIHGKTRTMCISGEASIGRNWGKYHPEKNPGGLKEI